MKILDFFDFDGTLMDSPTPDTGKVQWAEFYGQPYPHKGWWGRAESLDLKVFDIQPRETAYAAYKQHEQNPDVYSYILTSRVPKLEPQLQAILDKNAVSVMRVLCAHSTLTKGQRIVNVIAAHREVLGETVVEVNMWDDRNKEIATVEAVRPVIEGMGIRLNVYKIESDATD